MLLLKRSLKISLLIINLSFVYSAATAQQYARPFPEPASWTQHYQPFRIAGNLYYVGSNDLTSYLITTPVGLILINTGIPGSDSMILENVRTLGFRVADIKILLATHAHYDHVGGMAAIKKITGAKMMIHGGDARVLGDGGKSDYVFGDKGATFPPVRADRLLHDHDTVSLGDMRIVVLHHPGHTPGACSFLFDVKDENRSWRVLIANMPSILSETKLSGMPLYPNVGKDYAYTIREMKKLSFDIWFASHNSQDGLLEKHKPGDAYNPSAFIDRAGYDAAIGDLQKAYDEKVRNENKPGEK